MVEQLDCVVLVTLEWTGLVFLRVLGLSNSHSRNFFAMQRHFLLNKWCTLLLLLACDKHYVLKKADKIKCRKLSQFLQQLLSLL